MLVALPIAFNALQFVLAATGAVSGQRGEHLAVYLMFVQFPLILLLFAGWIISIVIRRIRDAGLPQALGLVPIGLLAINWHHLVVFSGVVVQVFQLNIPRLWFLLSPTLLLAITMLVALCFVPSASKE